MMNMRSPNYGALFFDFPLLDVVRSTLVLSAFVGLAGQLLLVFFPFFVFFSPDFPIFLLVLHEATGSFRASPSFLSSVSHRHFRRCPLVIT